MEEINGPRQIPFFVGRYRCEEYLGGGMADVYRARDTELPRDVAIKILKPGNEQDEEIRRAFIDEVQLASRCSHENIVTTYDKGEFDGAPFIVMEFLCGQHLGRIIKTTQRDTHAILKMALQIARALEYVHSQKIVHRDLKPQNLNVDPSGRVKLVDFGVAKAVDWNKTQAGFVKGTAYYMAPEQVLGQPVSFATDVWAFGVVLYEMLTGGNRPFEATRIEELWTAIVHAPPDYQLLAHSRTPPEVEALVRRCLEKKPERRYAGFAPICRDLERLLDSMLHTSTVTVSRPRLANLHEAWTRSTAQFRVGIVAAVAILVFTLATVVWLATRPEKRLTLATGNMVLVSAGRAMIGPEKQLHEINLAAFYIDETEVSNRAYAAFLRATGYRRPKNFAEDKPDYPVVNVTFDDAREFAKWAGKRLPTDLEWEKAARGSTGQAFPWGNKPDPRLANVAEKAGAKGRGILPVTAFPEGKSPFGALNMCGNVWEWVDAFATPTPSILALMQADKQLVPSPTAEDSFNQIRGGCYRNPLTAELITDSSPFPVRLSSRVIGFRCARSYERH